MKYRVFNYLGIALIFCSLNASIGMAQDLDFIADESETEISDSSCSEGGQIWVCGSDQLAQAHSDFNLNCSGWNYKCGRTLKIISDVCAPQIVVSKIYSEGC